MKKKLKPSIKFDIKVNYQQCPNCSRQFKNNQWFQRHIEEHKNGKYKCDKCATELKSNRSSNRHRAMHRLEKHIKCSYCTKTFKHSDNLKMHLIFHTGERTFKCRQCNCNKSFYTIGHLNEHVRHHHSNIASKERFNCEYCDKGFYYPVQLLVHSRGKHTKKCKICTKTFVRESHLNTHLKNKHSDLEEGEEVMEEGEL